MHLRYCTMTANLGCKENRHPQVVMKELGISYQHATPQSMADQWWFWNCENIPLNIPEYLDEIDLDPYDFLSKEKADKIMNHKSI